MATKKVFLEVSAGDVDANNCARQEYDNTVRFLRDKGAAYGLSSTSASRPEDLDASSRELLLSVWDGEREYSSKGSARIDPPASLVLGRVVIALTGQAPKALDNFAALCTGARGFSKQVKTARLHYLDVPFHRIVADFVCQGGDVTRRDGSGGDSVFGGKFNDEKQALVKGWRKGTVAMANAGKNSNTSQFFLCLSDDKTKYAKIEGKHVVLGEATDAESLAVLDKINSTAASASGEPKIKVWVSNCGEL
ncbi:hypothetical protein RI367_004702 [Sorochytrium milnesiophthora]